MSSRSNYKRRLVQHGRALAKAIKANASRSSDSTKSTVTKSWRRLQKLMDWIGGGKPVALIAVASLAVTLYFGIWPRSSQPVFKPISTAGGPNPAALFHGQPCASVIG